MRAAPFLQMAALLSSLTLGGSYVLYRGGVFHPAMLAQDLPVQPAAASVDPPRVHDDLEALRTPAQMPPTLISSTKFATLDFGAPALDTRRLSPQRTGPSPRLERSVDVGGIQIDMAPRIRRVETIEPQGAEVLLFTGHEPYPPPSSAFPPLETRDHVAPSPATAPSPPPPPTIMSGSKFGIISLQPPEQAPSYALHPAVPAPAAPAMMSGSKSGILSLLVVPPEPPAPGASTPRPEQRGVVTQPNAAATLPSQPSSQ